MLHILYSNRWETLRDEALIRMAETPHPVFEADQFIVPSAAMRRALTLSIAEHQGICANVEFSFLARWLWRQIARLVPGVSAESPFAPPVLAWRIYGIFGDAAFCAPFPRLAAYLGRADAVMRFDLATRTAGLLDQYITYRPDWLEAWAQGEPAGIAGDAQDEDWQAALWSRIMADLGAGRQHPAATFLRAVETLGPDAAPPARLPASAHLFCLPAMPPLYIDLLCGLGRWMDLHLYLLNPCREYWFEVVDSRRLSYLAARGQADYHEEGHRLLAAWGKQTQALGDLLLESAREVTVDEGLFAPNPAGTLLAQVQNGILDLADAAPGELTLAAEDRSLEIHACHSLTRELEVLQDQLLAQFAAPNAPRAQDILVVTPDLEAAAPLIDAVFGNVPVQRRIPYAITGRGRSTPNPAARALLALLSLAQSRFGASAVFDLLQQPMVGRSFGMAGDDLLAVRDWIQDAGIRWGIDAEHRTRLDLPGEARHSFADGLHRLFLGYALPDETAAPFAGRLPAGGAEGSGAAVLGSFWLFVDTLMRLQQSLSLPRPAGEWPGLLLQTLNALCEAEEDEIDDLREVEAALQELAANLGQTVGQGVGQSGLAEKIPLKVVQTALTALLDDPARGGVPTGAVTFSSMSSLRNLPFRVVCVLGLNDGAFPTTARPAEFDLIPLAPRRGDRQRRHDERNLFLDLLLAAHDRLYLSYTGRSVRDNAPLPPSVLVAELLEYLLRGLGGENPDGETLAALRARLVVEHPLQPFSPAAFDTTGDPRQRSFNAEYCAALQAALAPQPAAGPALAAGREDEDEEAAGVPATAFFTSPLPTPDEPWRSVALESLLEFFRNPCRYLLRRRLGLDLPRGEEELQDDEPFLPDYSARTQLAGRLLPAMLEQADPAALHALARAGTEYPPGRLGEILLEREVQALQAFAAELREATAPPCLPPHQATLVFDLDGERWELAGAFADLRATGLVRQRYDDVRAGDYLAGWLEHLFVCAAAPTGVELETRWFSRDGSYRLRPCAEARSLLGDLLHLYRDGLQLPLHFYPKSAWKFMEGGQNTSRAASTWWSTRDRPYGEEEDPAYGLALRGVADPLDEAFERNAATVFAPLLRFIEDSRLAT
jgi:exodeoxyribonuclease V gamma subunit